ncbi:pentapeptide repeat-containing protein [Streptomyces katsurahamanus]|uniref:Pentapeptide repeat-containing protein n=1 Tax=Streptomyces katsurahamanus TaxID=2577098 RepID=A0ABW9NZS9_9ACTN|nr:pentapeptide repeat-containing protein [Streptomyces katsurahamanus]MQS38808.1 pentapeptide repeat-containing protein [Streptomyces katsurahamanus]
MAIRRERANVDPYSGEPPVPDERLVVRGEDWYGRDLSGRRFTRYTFYDSDWTEVVNDGAVFDECTFSGVKFNASRHVNAAFTNCVFKRCGFFDTRFEQCKAVGSLFQQCAFGLLRVTGGDWSFVGLPGADLRGADFDGVRMRECDLTGARLEKATVTGVDLSGAMLHSAKLAGADLRGSDLSALDPRTVELAGAKIDLEQAAVIATALGLDVS